MQLYNDVNSDLHCFICTFLGGTWRDVRRHASRMHPDVDDFNWPLGDKRHRHAPAGTTYCNTCQIFIGAYNGELHKLNARHSYLCRSVESSSKVVPPAATIVRKAREADTNANDSTDTDIAPFYELDGVENPDCYAGHDGNDSTRTPLVTTHDSGTKYCNLETHSFNCSNVDILAAALPEVATAVTRMRDWLDGRDNSLNFESHPWVGEIVLSPADVTGYPTFIVGKEIMKDRARNPNAYVRCRIAEVDESHGDAVC